MNYLSGSFSVAAIPSEQYRDNWERTFGKKEIPSHPPSQAEMVAMPVVAAEGEQDVAATPCSAHKALTAEG